MLTELRGIIDSRNAFVSSYTHGGGLQFSAAPNNDFSDWVSQDQGFIAVNMGYRCVYSTLKYSIKLA